MIFPLISSCGLTFAPVLFFIVVYLSIEITVFVLRFKRYQWSRLYLRQSSLATSMGDVQGIGVCCDSYCRDNFVSTR